MEKIMALVKNTFICLLLLFILYSNANAEEISFNKPASEEQDNILKREEKKKKVLGEYQKIETKEEINRAELAAVFAIELDILYAKEPVPTGTGQGKSQIIVDIGNHWAKDFIKEITTKGIMEIYSNHNFIPERKITRAEFAYYIQEIISRFKNDDNIRNKFANTDSPFIDISKEHVHYNPVILAVTTGILPGTSPDAFSPQEMISGKLAVDTMHKLREYLDPNDIK
jgi:hypothetical protein